MKLGTLRNGRPDGQLVGLSSDLGRYVSASRIAPSLQAALDNWDAALPALEDLAKALDAGSVASAPFDPTLSSAPLPRAYQRIVGAGYPTHRDRAAASEPSKAADSAPARRTVLYQAASDTLGGPTQSLLVRDDERAPDLSAEFAVILGPVPMRPSREEALAAVRLLLLGNAFEFTKQAAEDSEGAGGHFQSQPLSCFAPAAVTPQQLGNWWRNGRLHLQVRVLVNAMLFGQPNAGVDMAFDFGDLIVAAARNRPLGNGTILSAGTISNRHDETPPIRREGIGFASIAEARTVETANYGRARTPYLKPGDRVRIVAVDAAERPVFGTIDQTVGLISRN